MDAMYSLFLGAPLMGITTVLLSILLFVHALASGMRSSSLERQKVYLLQKKTELESELENLRTELRGMRMWMGH